MSLSDLHETENKTRALKISCKQFYTNKGIGTNLFLYNISE